MNWTPLSPITIINCILSEVKPGNYLMSNTFTHHYSSQAPAARNCNFLNFKSIKIIKVLKPEHSANLSYSIHIKDICTNTDEPTNES